VHNIAQEYHETLFKKLPLDLASDVFQRMDGLSQSALLPVLSSEQTQNAGPLLLLEKL